MLVDRPLSRDAPEVLLPAVLCKYDIGDLAIAIGPRPVTVINPVDGLGKAVHENAFAKDWANVFESDASLGSRVLLLQRDLRAPLPVQ
jgi:hypothetical protein